MGCGGSDIVDWRDAPSGTGADGFFDLGVFQVRRRLNRYGVHFLPYAKFQDVVETEEDRTERLNYLKKTYDRFGETKCIATGIAIGLMERVKVVEHTLDPIVLQVENLLRDRQGRKLSKAEILSLTGLNEAQWAHFLARRPMTINLESHGRGAKYWHTGAGATTATATPPGPVPSASATDGATAVVPQLRFKDFVGQPQLQERLGSYIRAARERNGMLDHVLLSGPPGLGKSTLAEIIAGELGRPLHIVMAPNLTALDSAMAGVRDGEVVFLDEIHRLTPQQQEQLFAFMKRPITVIAATNFPARLLPSLRERFGITEDLRLYTVEELIAILAGADPTLDSAVAAEIAGRSRGTPRIALQIHRRLRDLNGLSPATMLAAFATLEIDESGLTKRDREYLSMLSRAENPLGLDTVATTLNESADTLEQVIEPFLLQQGFIERTRTGRIITDKGRKHIAPKGRRRAKPEPSGQQDLIP